MRNHLCFKRLLLWSSASPVVDLDVGICEGVVLEPHQLQVQDGRKRQEDDAFLSLLKQAQSTGTPRDGTGQINDTLSWRLVTRHLITEVTCIFCQLN